MAVDVGSAVGYLDLDISGFLKGLKTAQEEGNKTSQNIATKVGNNIAGMGKSITTAGSALTKSVTLPIVGAGTAIVTLSSNFESAMSKVSAISGATGSDFDKLKAKAQEMGAKTKFSATESAEAFTYMAMAGWKTEQMLQGIDGIMALAAADGLDLATTSDIVTDALTAFGMSAEESGHFADVLARASTNANTNVAMLGESFKYVGPVAGAFGYSVEDVSIALGLMANAGIKASAGGTALRQALAQLTSPTDDAAALMEKYGLSLFDSEGKTKSLMTVMGELRSTFKMTQQDLEKATEAAEAGDEAWAKYAASLPIDQQQKLQDLAEIFGVRAMPAMLAIIQAGEEDFNKLSESIYDADGAAQQMADTMLNNLSGQVTILKSSLEGLALQFGEIILPYVKKFVEKIQELVQKFQSLSPQQKEQVVKWAAIAAAIGPCLLIVGKLTTSVGKMIAIFGKLPGAITKAKGGFNALTTCFTNMKEGFALSKAGFSGLATEAGGFGTKMGVAMAGVTGPMLAIAAVIGVVIAAFVSLWKNNEEFRDNILAIWGQIKETFAGFTQGIVDLLNSLGFNFGSITDVIKAVWEGFCNFLAPIFTGVFQQISNAFKFITDSILNILRFWISLFKGDWEGAWNAIKAQFQNVCNFIKETFQNVLNTLSSIWNAIAGIFQSLWVTITGFFTGIWTDIQNIFGSVVDFFRTAFSNAWEAIKNVFSGVKTFFTGIWNTIKTVFTTLGTSIGNAISGAVKSGINAVITMVENTINTAIGLINSAIKLANKLPGVDVGTIGKLELPRLAKGGIVTAATVAMIGEDGKEAVVPLEKNLGWMKKLAGEFVNRLSNLFVDDIGLNSSFARMNELLSSILNIGKQLVVEGYGYISYNDAIKQKKFSQGTNEPDRDIGNGDTFIFHSPKPIDEIEAAKQIKKAKRDLAEGF